jgi:hypothetical protein
MSNTDKPPLGLRPKRIAKKQRLIEIFDAIIRYTDVKKKVPKKWLREFCKLAGGN